MTRPSDPSLSAWVSANAGAGKTRVLVERVIRLLLAGSPPERLLCLTFTKAAATEMAMRLSDRLGKWALLDESELREDIRGIGVPDPDADMLAKARTLFARALETPGGLKIQTIHAFCERLLGRFPLEAKLSAHFTVADERTAAELLRVAQEGVLTSIARGQDAHGADALNRLARMQDERGFEDLLRDALSKRSLLNAFLRAHPDPEERREVIARAVGLDAFCREEEIINGAVEAGDEASLLDAAKILVTGSKRDSAIGERILAFFESSAERRKADWEVYAQAFLTQDDHPRKDLMTKTLRMAHPHADDALRCEQDRLLGVVEHLRAARAAGLTDAMLALVGRVLERYETIKARRALLDYHDLIQKAGELLTRHQAAWVLYKLDGGLDHILIDEAQDTSPEQWTVITALSDEFFAGAGARSAHRTVFAVGDEKQSIYSFQGADPSAFDRMKQHFASRLEGSEARWSEFELIDSYRSVEPVLTLTDRVFADERYARALSTGARRVVHHVKRLGQAGRVELWPPERPDPVPKPDPWTLPVDYVGSSSPVVRLAQRVTDRIDAYLKGSEPCAPNAGPARPGDILVLVQRRGPFVEELIRRLKQRGIPVAGADRLDILEHIAVMDLRALGMFVLLPEDDLTLAALLRSPLIGLSEEELLTVAQAPGRQLWDKLKALSETSFAAARALLERARARADFVAPYDFFAECLNEGGGREKLVRRLGQDANDPIDEFLRLALDYERLHPPSLEGFLAWIAQGSSEIKRDLDHGRDEVRVMTVHGAKGLEAPIVILPDTCSTLYERARAGFVAVDSGGVPVPVWSRGQKQDPAPVAAAGLVNRQASADEHLRLLYVALTRARDSLLVCGHETTKGRPAMSWHALVDNAMAEWAAPATDATGAPVLRADSQLLGESDRRAQAASAPRERIELPAFLKVNARSEEPHGPTLSPSALAGPDAPEPPVRAPGWAQDADRVRFLRGRLIHRLLEWLPDVSRETRSESIARFLKNAVHGLSEGEQADIAAAALRVLETPEFEKVFAPGSRAEVPIIGEIALHGRLERIYGVVDRLAVTSDAVLIVDYKTNRPPARALDQVPLLYLRQMAAYRAVLLALYPDREVHAALLWTEGPALMPLPPAALDQAMKALGAP